MELYGHEAPTVYAKWYDVNSNQQWEVKGIYFNVWSSNELLLPRGVAKNQIEELRYK